MSWRYKQQNNDDNNDEKSVEQNKLVLSISIHLVMAPGSLFTKSLYKPNQHQFSSMDE